MGQCVRKLSNLLEETEPAPYSYKASIHSTETAKATHKGNLLLTDNEILFYENKKVCVLVISCIIKFFSEHFLCNYVFLFLCESVSIYELSVSMFICCVCYITVLCVC